MAQDSPEPSEPNPFSGLPFIGDIMKMFQSSGPIHWDTARQTAQITATEGGSEPYSDPLVRIEYADLARIASMQVREITSIDAGTENLEPTMVSRGEWAQRTLDDYRPLFTELATALSAPPPANFEANDDPFASMFAGLTSLIAPMTMGMTIGSMVGLLAKKAIGQYELPLPRGNSRQLLIVSSSVDSFANEWDLPVRDVRMFVLIHELAIHHLYSVVHIREAVESRIKAHVAAFRPDPSAIGDKLGSLESGDPNDMMQSLQKILSDPELLLGAVESPAQASMRADIDAVIALVIGWTDYMTDLTGARVLGNPANIAEALRRRRVTSGDETKFVERLLGLRIDRHQVERGRNFVKGVVERAGIEGLAPLYTNSKSIPTPNEIDAPGLWLARLEVSSD